MDRHWEFKLIVQLTGNADDHYDTLQRALTHIMRLLTNGELNRFQGLRTIIDPNGNLIAVHEYKYKRQPPTRKYLKKFLVAQTNRKTQ